MDMWVGRHVSDRRPILVTGSIRSGTTWVGRTMGTAPGVAVIHEPFNKDHPIGVFAQRWSTQYTYLTEGRAEAKDAHRAMGDTLGHRYRAFPHLRNPEGLLRALGMLRDLPRFQYRRHFSRPRTVVKDPIALFSAEWLADRFDMDVVIMVRHPGAFAWSYQRIAEPNRFADLLRQQALMEGPLAQFAEPVERAARTADPIYQAAILWRIVYATVAGYQDRHPDWVMIRQEDLSADPLREFADLFARLGLAFTEGTKRFIARTSSPLNPAEAPGGKLHHIRRNSRQSVDVWQKRLSSGDIERLRHLTEDVADRFYTASSWLRSSGAIAPEATRS
jgi:hypothetical protein